jgi:acyclic terpene utilization AtuA family protein
MTRRPLRVANCSGFWGDRQTAAREMVDGGAIDVLTGDYLAELTLGILARRVQAGGNGWVPTGVAHITEVLSDCLERGIKIVVNTGGLDPKGAVDAVRSAAAAAGLDVSVAAVTGDDISDEVRADRALFTHMDDGWSIAERDLDVLSANAYLGCWGIARALQEGADVVVTGRVTDASLVMGAAAWWHDWSPESWDELAGSLVAGHLIECGTQVTGGNFAFFQTVGSLDHLGFPIAEIAADGSAVITKHPGTGGRVNADTLRAQLLYEIGPPDYLNPDVVAALDTVTVTDRGDDRVEVTGTRGYPPPATTKVACVTAGGFRNQVTFLIAGLDADEKANAATSALWTNLGGRERFGEVQVRWTKSAAENPPSHAAAFNRLTICVIDRDREKVDKAFSRAAIELALANYPGLTVTAPPGRASPHIIYVPCLILQRPHFVHVEGVTHTIQPPTTTGGSPVPRNVGIPPSAGESSTVRAPIGRVVGARSGDKGGDANLGVWARSEPAYGWLFGFLTAARLAELLPDLADYTIDRYELPNVQALNFVVRGYLGDGALASTALDPQAKALGEYFRSRVIDVPEDFLAY